MAELSSHRAGNHAPHENAKPGRCPFQLPTLRAPGELQSVGLLELLETDERPILIFDLMSKKKTIPVYSNPQLHNLQSIVGKAATGVDTEAVEEVFRDNLHSSFAAWAVSDPITGPPAAIFGGLEWICQTLRTRWRVVSAQISSQIPYISGTSSPAQGAGGPQIGRSKSIQLAPGKFGPLFQKNIRRNHPDRQLEAFRLCTTPAMSIFPLAGKSLIQPDSPAPSPSSDPFGFTAPNTCLELSTHIRWFLSFNWAATDLGPISSWSAELRRMANLMLSDPRAVAIYWGPNRTMIYNEAYIAVIGQKHPRMMGKPFMEAWEEVAVTFTPQFDKAYDTGLAVTMNEALFYIDRHGYLEESYYSFSVIPLATSDGVAFYNPIIDSTQQVISDRRMTFLFQLGQYVACSRGPKDFWSQLLKGLEPKNMDIPFALLYSAGSDINEALSVSSGQIPGLNSWVLEGTIRVGEQLANIPRRLSSAQALEEFIPNFSNIVQSEAPTYLHTKDGTLPATIVQDLVDQDHPEPCDAAIFLPIRSASDNIRGFLIIGVNARKRYDDDDRRFIELLSRQLATSLAAAVLEEDEKTRKRLAPDLPIEECNSLSRKLAIQTLEDADIESRFRKMADMAPVGMFQFSAAGKIIYCNERWYEITDHGRDLTKPMSWYNVVEEEDHHLLDAQWAALMGGKESTFELRLKRPYDLDEMVAGEKVQGHTWILAAAYPEKSRDGTVTAIFGCLTDISRQKWTEGFLKRKMVEAIERKTQQENFIDMTSHEMRNPLSAILHCADFISTSIAEFGGDSSDIIIPMDVSESCTDAAQTIILCAQHQKRIIDDILMLSKLDSDLLVITPVDSQPVSVIQNALRMFDGELQRGNISLRFRVEPSFTNLNIDWVKLDPSRMLQVLINLLTNAIKFTQSETRRNIVISIGAALTPPTTDHEVEFLPRSPNRKDMSLSPSWGTGETVFLRIEVQDSGCGLTDHERKLLFQRFSQASPRTHVQYGGSGLGLFISRELTELQGGQIGVASKAGVGSTFSFYIRTRRCKHPEPQSSTSPTPANTSSHSRTVSETSLPPSRYGLLPVRSPEPRCRSPLLGPKHILVVEDNLVNQRVLTKQLHSAGCIISVANHGGEALEYLKTSRFWQGQQVSGKELSLVLMDLEMPIMDGLTCVKHIRKLQEEGLIVAHVPVIAVTANARSEQIATAKEAGMDCVVTKPFRIPELIPEMDRQLRRHMKRPSDAKRSFSFPC